MEQAVLTETQKTAIKTVGSEPKLSGFYLSGGTALSGYYLQHRWSDDLDFFTDQKPDLVFLHSFIEKLKATIGANSVRYERLNDRNIFFLQTGREELKMEFSEYPFPQLEKSVVKDGIKIDSLRDIAANKLMAMLDRFDPKDFVDLFFLLKGFKLDTIRKDVEKKFGIKVDDVFLGGELAKVKRVEALPKMIKKITAQELKDFFSQKAKELESKVIE
ncbi:hypothetical protein A2276_07230 [candidate division WOR-1 bacterium RIFOXYA12_FULL_43_27]|uniref:Nucleotidyl transferase AbiEii/AbiGii toxin family protein n=1 Tax=candidate division WOR-1 bacterium RIFOXYC2_FULL_46_14 TaxID=1802587 RepID=A0A1F4U5T8_UNCSA|nr:MAG: hypothetical protein A2276_07230 [candidate division WOR-1 bacterium RIFOXYA12_FULL_43_27]OGC20401.1 MAG: hypothetical protein A2292_05055 [candidate division WOR-1 bacterium RIFOXYB2_FULL_46_45]OGC31862.1 MAG: hypothetical protein A2232_06395 [candidate division WOR-1 bacterium RIFOXYA2_FULL_46_56]OGC40247.1 MAG: hypothetical protein A2438_03075 [candidate division WOR-1 bacterium RIFOXYC2_FULL_46_14]